MQHPLGDLSCGAGLANPVPSLEASKGPKMRLTSQSRPSRPGGLQSPYKPLQTACTHILVRPALPRIMDRPHELLPTLPPIGSASYRNTLFVPAHLYTGTHIQFKKVMATMWTDVASLASTTRATTRSYATSLIRQPTARTTRSISLQGWEEAPSRVAGPRRDLGSADVHVLAVEHHGAA